PHNSHVVPFLLIYSLTCSSIPRPARSTPFPYTTLFRSRDDPHRREVEVLGDSSRDDLRQVLGGGIHREEDELLLVFEESVAEGIVVPKNGRVVEGVGDCLECTLHGVEVEQDPELPGGVGVEV